RRSPSTAWSARRTCRPRPWRRRSCTRCRSTEMFQALRRRLRAWMRPRGPETLPATLRRNRIYVLPTATGLFFAALVAAMGIGALNFNNNPALLLVLLLAGTALASLIAAHLQLSGLRVVAVAADPVAAGEELRLRIALDSADARLRRGLRIGHDGDAVHARVDAHGSTVELPLATRQRGLMPLPRLELSTVQPLGLARAWAYAWPAQSALVYPAPEAQAPPLPRTPGAATARAPPGARWRGRPRRGATACWCANTNSSAAANWCWTGSSPAACRTNNASAGWRAGSTTPSARAAATRCGCRARRRSRWAWGRSTGIAACARWPCCRARPAMADALAADDIPAADAGAKPRSPAMAPGARAQALLAAAACLLPLLLQLPGALAVGFGIGAVAVAAASRQRPLLALLRLLLGLCGIVAVAAVLPGIGRDTACAMLAAMLA